MMIDLTKPHGSYSKDDPHWHRYVYSLMATYNLSKRDIAAKLNKPTATLDNHELTILAINEGRADFNIRVMGELTAAAFADPMEAADTLERSQIRVHKMDALRQLMKLEENREKTAAIRIEAETNQNLLKALSVEELKAKASRLLAEVKS